jgi:tetratricopeptide (TPR) repeat protein
VKHREFSSQFLISSALLILLGGLFALSRILYGSGFFAGRGEDSILAQFFGESRQAIGFNFGLEADRYFHKGVPHQDEPAFSDPYRELKDILQPREHVHEAGRSVYEIMPWLRFATYANPHYVDAYLGAAYWAAREDRNMLPQALAILDEARRNNPDDYRIPLQRALLLMRCGRLEEASSAIMSGLRLWERTAGVDPERKKIDLAALFNYQGALFEAEGKKEEARNAYLAALKIQPDAEGIGERVRAIDSGSWSREEAIKRLDYLFTQCTAYDLCDRHDHDDEHDHLD